MRLCWSIDLYINVQHRLIAIMLGRLEMSVDECIEEYVELMATVFGARSRRIPMSWRGRIKPRFDSRNLENAVKQVLSRKGMAEDAKFDDGAERGCKTYVPMHLSNNRS